MNLIAAGRRRHLVTLQTMSEPVSDGDGGFTSTPTTLATVRAAIEPATTRALERVTSGTVIAEATHLVTVPYISGVTTETRVLFGARILYILGVMNPEESNRELQLVCSEVVA